MTNQDLLDALTAIRVVLLNRGYLSSRTRALMAFDALIVKLQKATLRDRA